MRESIIEKHFVEAAAKAGGLQRKVEYLGRRGCPDRLVGFPHGRHALIELKRLRGRARDEQVREHVRLRSIGFDVRVLASIEAVDEFIAELLA